MEFLETIKLPHRRTCTADYQYLMNRNVIVITAFELSKQHFVNVIVSDYK